MNSSFNRNLRGISVAVLLAAVLVVGIPATSSAQLDPSMATGSTSSTLRKQAASRIPMQKLSPAVARKVSAVVNDASLYRQLPVTTITSDPDMYLFLLRYPETIISTWRLMGISDMTAQRVSPFTLHADDGAGTTTRADLVYGQPNLNIYYAEGEYEGPMLFRKVTGKCVIMVESNYNRAANGKVQVTSRMNFFMKIDNLAASIIAKTVHPLVGTTADHNFVETLKFAEKLSETSSLNGPGVQKMGGRLPQLDRDVRQRFQEMAGIVWQRAQGSATGTSTAQTGFDEPTRSPHQEARQNSAQLAAYHQPTHQQPSMPSRPPAYAARNSHQYQSHPSFQHPSQYPSQHPSQPRGNFRTMQRMPQQARQSQQIPQGRQGYSMGDQSGGGYSMGDIRQPAPANYRGR